MTSIVIGCTLLFSAAEAHGLTVLGPEHRVDRVMVNGHKRIRPETRLTHYVDLLKSADVTLWADLYWGTWHESNGGPMVDLSVARAWVNQGLDGGFSYYMRARPTEWERINWQLRLVDFPDVYVDPHYAQRAQKN